jgi:hypothetical protein
LTAGVSPSASNGGTSTAVLQDINALLQAITTDQNSEIFICISSAIAKAWAAKVTSTGEFLFPPGSITLKGGEIMGARVFVSDAIGTTIVAFDASQLATFDGGIFLDTARYASVQLDTTPDSPPGAASPYLSFWQMGILGVKAVRVFSVERLRSTAVAAISGVSYSGNSPA